MSCFFSVVLLCLNSELWRMSSESSSDFLQSLSHMKNTSGDSQSRCVHNNTEISRAFRWEVVQQTEEGCDLLVLLPRLFSSAHGRWCWPYQQKLFWRSVSVYVYGTTFSSWDICIVLELLSIGRNVCKPQLARGESCGGSVFASVRRSQEFFLGGWQEDATESLEPLSQTFAFSCTAPSYNVQKLSWDQCMSESDSWSQKCKQFLLSLSSQEVFKLSIIDGGCVPLWNKAGCYIFPNDPQRPVTKVYNSVCV